MKICELQEKASQIEELAVRQYNDNMYFYKINTDNQEIATHLKQVIKNLELEDMYSIPETNKWIKKSTINNIINVVKNATTYQEINEENLGYLGFISYIQYSRNEDMTTRVRIGFGDFDYRKSLRKLIQDKLNEIDGICARTDGKYGLYIDSEKIDAREQCKHACKAQYRIKKINEIFEL